MVKLPVIKIINTKGHTSRYIRNTEKVKKIGFCNRGLDFSWVVRKLPLDSEQYYEDLMGNGISEVRVKWGGKRLVEERRKDSGAGWSVGLWLFPAIRTVIYLFSLKLRYSHQVK
ncbi:hydrolase, partial [Striga asiatica]